MPPRPSDSSRLYARPVTEATPAPPTNDPLHEITQDARFRGTLFYAPKIHIPNGGGAYSTFVMRGLGLTKNIAGQPTAIATYLVNSGGQLLFSPRFSPDGRYISYGGGSDFYVWDFAGKQIHLVNPKAQTDYNELPWSPNSRHVAFADNVYASGDPAENYTSRLHTYDVVTKTTRMVVENPLLSNPLGWRYPRAAPLAWTPQGNLLFPKLPKPREFNPDPDAPVSPHPNIYAIAPEGGKATLVVPNAYDPQPSPDGKWIAYSGWYTVEADKPEADGTPASTVAPRQTPVKKQMVERPAVFLFNKAQKKRILIRPLPLAQRRVPITASLRLRWTPDSQRLILIELSRTEGPVNKSQAQARVSVLPVPPPLEPRVEPRERNAQGEAMVSQAAIKPLATLLAQEGFEVGEISRDGQFLRVNVGEGAAPGPVPGLESEVVSTQAVDLRDGSVSLMVRFHNNGGGHLSGWGWYDQPTQKRTPI